MDTNTLISICACAIGITQFLLWKHISRTKTYIEEKSKLLAQEEKIESLTTIAEKAKNAVTKKDIEEITEKIEVIKNEISFENQRKNIYIEQRTERFINLLHLAENLQSQQNLLLFYLYDNNSTEKISKLMEDLNLIYSNLIHESRMIYATINDSEINESISTLRNKAEEYVMLMLATSSNIISFRRNMELCCKTTPYTKHSEAILIENKEKHDKTKTDFENEVKEKKDVFYNSIISYIIVLKKLFKKDFHIKLDFLQFDIDKN